MNLWLRSLIFLHHGNDSFPTHGGEGLAIKPAIVSLTYLVRRVLKWAFIFVPSFYRKLLRRSLGQDFKDRRVWMWKEALKREKEKKKKA